MNDFPSLLRTVIAGEDLSAAATAQAFGAIMDETLSAPRAAALLAALAAKGESVDEVIGAATAMRDRSVHVEHGLPLVIDVCGTGGDGACTINISTAVAFIVAGAGVAVAKHGNRAASSACGSADVLEALGVELDRSPERAVADLQSCKTTFLFAQRYHPAMRVVGPIRRELGVRTIFNILGPLTNPAAASRQVVGVPHSRFVGLVGEALRGLGAQSGAVIHARNGLDEVAGDAPTEVYQFDQASARTWLLDPADYGIAVPLEALRGGDAASNATALLSILHGETSPRADVVILNAALALTVAGAEESIGDAMETARRSIASGAAVAALEALRGERTMELV